MSFIGIIADQKDFTILKTKIQENIDLNNVTFININKRSVANIKNIKFETIIICNDLNGIKDNFESLNKICKNANYLILNSDILMDLSDIICNNSNIITYGLNSKAKVTVSSVKEDNLLVALQHNLKNLFGEVIEVGETNIKLEEDSKIKIYHILILYIIFILYTENNLQNDGKICFF